MSSELMKRLVSLEDEKHIKDGFTRKLALALVHDLEAAVGEGAMDPAEIVLLRHMSSPMDFRTGSQTF